MTRQKALSALRGVAFWLLFVLGCAMLGDGVICAFGLLPAALLSVGCFCGMYAVAKNEESNEKETTMLSEPEIGEIKCAYRQAANPQKQIGVLADLYAISKAQVMELVGATQERPRAARKNEIARAKWDEQKTALPVSMVDEGRTLLFMAKMPDLTIAQVRSKLNQMDVRLRETGKEDALSTVCPDEPAAPSQMAQEMQAEVLRDLQTERVAYPAFDLLVAEAAERTDLDMSYCRRAAIAEIDKLMGAWADKLRKHSAAEASFAHIIALFVLDELLERGAANVQS